jgi:nucleotide-binding universal stress UspA family protein
MNLLLAIDGSSCSDAAVRAVIEQFRPDTTVVRVLHVIDWSQDLPSSLDFVEGPAAARSVLRARHEESRRSEALLARAAEQLERAHFSVTARSVHGEVGRTIVEMVAGWPADIIVLGSHGRKGLRRLWLGRVPEDVVHHAPCSVQLVREPAAVRRPASVRSQRARRTDATSASRGQSA